MASDLAASAGRFVLAVGLPTGAILLALLMATLARPALRIWPTPGPNTWQDYVFWPLFRGLNVLTVLAAIVGWPGGTLGLPAWVRIVAAAIFVGSTAVFLYAFRVLGRGNSYGATDGLVTSGIYQWSRNPQNANLMIVYGALAVAADSGPGYVLAAMTVLVYWLMILLEEPWLAARYGDSYQRYRAEVPRLFNWRRMLSRGD